MAEGTVSNIFIVCPASACLWRSSGYRDRGMEKSLLTPSTGSGILRGVTREFVMELARKRGLSVVETPLTRHDIYTAQECFLTNTSSEVLPVVRLDSRCIGNGSPGPVTRALGEDFRNQR